MIEFSKPLIETEPSETFAGLCRRVAAIEACLAAWPRESNPRPTPPNAWAVVIGCRSDGSSTGVTTRSWCLTGTNRRPSATPKPQRQRGWGCERSAATWTRWAASEEANAGPAPTGSSGPYWSGQAGLLVDKAETILATGGGHTSQPPTLGNRSPHPSASCLHPRALP